MPWWMRFLPLLSPDDGGGAGGTDDNETDSAADDPGDEDAAAIEDELLGGSADPQPDDNSAELEELRRKQAKLEAELEALRSRPEPKASKQEDDEDFETAEAKRIKALEDKIERLATVAEKQSSLLETSSKAIESLTGEIASSKEARGKAAHVQAADKLADKLFAQHPLLKDNEEWQELLRAEMQTFMAQTYKPGLSLEQHYAMLQQATKGYIAKHEKPMRRSLGAAKAEPKSETKGSKRDAAKERADIAKRSAAPASGSPAGTVDRPNLRTQQGLRQIYMNDERFVSSVQKTLEDEYSDMEENYD